MARRLTLLTVRRYSSSGHVFQSPYTEVEVPRMTINEYIWKDSAKWEDRTAVECGITGKKTTYRELRRMTEKLAENLRPLCQKGDGTALLVLPNCPEYPVAVLGCLSSGLTVSPANPLYTSGELRHQARDSGASLVIASSDCLQQVLSADLGLPVISVGDQPPPQGLHSFKQMTEEMPGKVTTERRQAKDWQSLAILPYSSGTTGLPKGVRLSHFNIIANLQQISHPIINPVQETTRTHQDTFPGVLPFFHIYGSTVVMLRGLCQGVKIVTLPKFHPQYFLKMIRTNQNIVLHAVPPIINFLGVTDEVKAEHLAGLRITVSGAAPCSSSDLSRLNEKREHVVVQAYGMTESSPVLTQPKPRLGETGDLASVGPPISNTLASVRDPDRPLETLPPGQLGELCFKGPQIMEGYHNNEEATKQTLDKEGWLHTGDLGYADQNGTVYIVDRMKELIKVKGFQVAPAELEGLLRQHPGVLDVGVTSAPSAKSGELPVAYLVLRPGTKLTEEEVKAWTARQVAPYKQLARVLLVEEVPKSAAGKILRRVLKDRARAELKLD